MQDAYRRREQIIPEIRPYAHIKQRACHGGCSVCPHPYVIERIQGRSRVLRAPTARELRHAGIRVPGLGAKIEAMDRLDQILRAEIIAADKLVDLADRLAREIDPAAPTTQGTEVCRTPFLAIRAAAKAMEQAAESLKNEVIRYNQSVNLTKHGRAREGALVIRIRAAQNGRPPTLYWRVAVRGKQGRWFFVDSRRHKLPKRLTPTAIAATGNASHIPQYLEFDRRMARLQEIQEQIGNHWWPDSRLQKLTKHLAQITP